MNFRRILFGVALLGLTAVSSNAQSPFLTGFALNSPPLRNDFGSFVGMKLTVGSTALTVSSIGRVCVAGNSQTHPVKFVLASSGVDVAGASASVNMAGCTAGQFVYAAPAGSVTLAANTAYYLVSMEFGGGDKWYDYGTVTATSDATVNSSVYLNGGTYTPIDGANSSYVPPNFTYTGPPPPPPGTFVTAFNLNHQPARNDFTGFVGMQLTVGTTPLTVNQLGRVCVAGNSRTHIVKFVLAGNGTDVPGGSATVNMAGCTGGQFVYSPPASPITLLANTSYYLVTQETAGLDQWYDQGALTTTTAAAVTGPVYSNGSAFITNSSPNNSYVPPNFQYGSNCGSPISVVVGTNPSGLSFSVDSTPYTSTQTFNWIACASHTIATTTPQSTAAGTQQVFNSWSDGGAISHTVAPMNPATFTASFGTQYLLTLNVNPGAGGSLIANPSSATGYYDAGTSVQLTANANSGFAFSNFSGDLTGSTNPQSITMSAPHSVTANFIAAPPVMVTVATNPSGLTFMVDGSPFTTGQTFNFAPGSTHTIATTSPQIVSPGTQQAFANWSDGGAISHAIVVPNTNITYTANFATQYLLTTTVTPAGGGSIVASPPSATGYYNSGTLVQLTATANPGFTFTNFSGDLSGATNPQSITMLAPHSVTANFTSGGPTTFLTSFTSTSQLRNDYSGFVGMKLTVGATPLGVTSIGRVCVAGNSQTHTVKFVLAGTGVDVPGASASVSMVGCTPGSFVFASPAGSVTLQANTAYYLVSQETAGLDQWYEQAPVTGTGVATINSSVYTNGSNYITVSSPNTSYVPPNFTYAALPTPSGSAFVTAFNLNNVPLRNDFSGFLGMKLTIGSSAINAALLGRVCVAGNSATHLIEFVNAGDNSVAGSATVNMAGCTPGQFVYATPASPIHLTPNGTYYLASQETAGGDQWYDFNSISTTNAGSVTSSIYFFNGSWLSNAGPNTSYVPPNFIYAPQGTPIVLVTASRAPNAFGSPNWPGYVTNAITALETGVMSIGNPNTDPTAYFLVSRENERQNIVSSFPSWLGQANPSGAFVSELGNRLHFGLHIVGNGTKFSLSQLQLDMEGTDSQNLFQFMYAFSDSDSYTTERVGLSYGNDGIKGTADDVFINSGSSSQLVDELFYVGIGAALAPEDLGCPAGSDQAMLDCAAAYYTSIMPFTLSTVYSLSTTPAANGSAVVSFASSQNSTSHIQTAAQPVMIQAPKPRFYK